jgi:hypothetical protein
MNIAYWFQSRAPSTRHVWTMWEVSAPKRGHFGFLNEYRDQARRCVRCGLTQQRMLTPTDEFEGSDIACELDEHLERRAPDADL